MRMTQFLRIERPAVVPLFTRVSTCRVAPELPHRDDMRQEMRKCWEEAILIAAPFSKSLVLERSTLLLSLTGS